VDGEPVDGIAVQPPCTWFADPEESERSTGQFPRCNLFGEEC